MTAFEIAASENTIEKITIQSMLERFIDYLSVQPVTVQSYCVCLHNFSTWMQQEGITQPQRNDVAAYVRYLAAQHPNAKNGKMLTFSDGTQARYLRAVKLFFKWTAAEGLYPNVAERVKGCKVNNRQHKRDALTKEQQKRLLASIDRSTLAGKRDYAMVLTAISCVSRIIELQRADIKDFDISGRRFYYQGKGHRSKDDYVSIAGADTLIEAVDEYLTARGETDPAAPLFAGTGNRNSGRMTEPSMSRIIKQRLIAAGMNSHRLVAHSLRHSGVTNDLQAGATLQEAQMQAGHCDPATTEIYSHNIDKAAAQDTARILNYLFDITETPQKQAAALLMHMSAAKQQQAIELLKAIAE